MLTSEDIKKLIEAFKEVFTTKADFDDFKKDFFNLQTKVDGLQTNVGGLEKK